MRVLVTATMAASALAIGFGMNAAQSLSAGNPLGDEIGPDTSVQLVQRGEKEMSPGGGGMGSGRGQGMGGQGGGGGRGMQGGGMRGDGGLRPGGSQFRSEGRQFRSGERSMRGEGREFRSGERGMRGEGREFRSGERGMRGGRELRGEFGYREGRRRGYRSRDGIYFGPGYGYVPASCAWLRRRALETDSPYWWRRYRACRG